MEPIFKVENLSTWFPITKGVFKKVIGHVKAVDNVSFEIYKGETLGIVGESGCGKSTLGKTLMMLKKVTNGQVLFNYNGEYKDITKFNKREMFDFRKKVQMVFQDPYSALNPQKKIYTSFEEPLKVHGIDNWEEREQCCDVSVDGFGYYRKDFHQRAVDVAISNCSIFCDP